MKVIMLLSNPFKPDPRVYKEAKTLVKHGHNVKIIAWDREGRYPEKEEIEGIKIIRVGPKAKYGELPNLLLKIPLFWANVLLNTTKMDFDVVHCHDFDTLPIGLLMARVLGKKVVFDAHDFYFAYLTRQGGVSRFLGSIVRKLEVTLVRKIDGFITPTLGQLEYYKRFINVDIPREVIYNVAEKELFGNVRRSRREDFVVSYIGSIRYPKQIVNLFEATKDLKGVKVLVVGGGVAAKEVARRASNYAHVEVHGHSPYKEVPKFYQRSDCVYAVYGVSSINIRLCYPVKLFEAMICGLPVLVDKGTDAGDFVESNGVGFAVDGNNLAEIRDTICRLKNNPSVYHAMAKKARGLAEKKYNWGRMEKRLLDTYQELGSVK